MSGLLTKSSVFAAKVETTEGTLVTPGATDFIALRESFSFEGKVETVTSDELLADIGSSKSFTTKEVPSGSLPKYFKHSGVEGQAPQYAVMIKSAMGNQTTHGTEYDTISGSSAGSTATRGKVVVDTGEGPNFVKGQGLLIKDSTNNYRVRNVYSISSDDLNLNFNLPAAPASGVNLGKAIHFFPAANGHPTFSAWHYQASSSSALVQAMAGCRTTQMQINFTANQLAEINFDFEGIKFYFNPLTISSSNNKVNFKDASLGSELTATLSSAVYNNPHALAREIAAKMDALTGDTITCTYSNTTGKFTIASSGTYLSILWKTGTNGSDNTDTHVGTLIGFSDAADSTSALTYAGGSAISLDPTVTPSYDAADPIVVRDSEIVLGSFSEYLCRPISQAQITVGTPKTNIDSICASSGIDSSVINSRQVTFSAKLTYPQYDAGLFDKFINNTTLSVMVNTGVKSGGNWVPGTVVNVYIPNMSITAHPIANQDGYFVVDLAGTGFIDSAQKDLHINFL